MSAHHRAGRVIRQAWITRKEVEKNKHRGYVFGDNMMREGLGGQAAAMRGLPNAIGVPTKLAPSSQEYAYFTDASKDNPFVRGAIEAAFQQIKVLLAAGIDVVIPADGLGTGLSQLPRRAPRLHAWIESLISDLEDMTNAKSL